MNLWKSSAKVLGFAACLLLMNDPAFAVGADLPWEDDFGDFIASATGPVALTAGVLSIIAATGGLVFGENGSMMKKGLVTTGGLGVMFSAAALVTRFGHAGGLTI